VGDVGISASILAVEEYQRLTGRTVEPSGKNREDER